MKKESYMNLDAIFGKAQAEFQRIAPDNAEAEIASPPTIIFELPFYVSRKEEPQHGGSIETIFWDINEYREKNCFADVNKVYIAYKKDNASRFRKHYDDHPNKEGPPPPAELNKIHLKYCTGIQLFDNLEGNLVKTSRIDSKKLYSILNHKGDEVTCPLAVCELCIEELSDTLKALKIRPPQWESKKNGLHWDGIRFDLTLYAKRMAEHPELLENQEEMGDLRGEYASVGYQGGVHKSFKTLLIRINGYACSKCGVNLEKHLELLTMHHKDRNKANNTVDNCSLLCALCHFEGEHDVPVSEYQKNLILELRQAQNPQKPLN